MWEGQPYIVSSSFIFNYNPSEITFKWLNIQLHDINFDINWNCSLALVFQSFLEMYSTREAPIVDTVRIRTLETTVRSQIHSATTPDFAKWSAHVQHLKMEIS